MYAQDSRSRPPAVVDDMASRIYFNPQESSRNGGGFLSFVINMCYSFVTSILQLVSAVFRSDVTPVASDPVKDVINFIRSYEEKYGTNHPVFYQGSYSQALSDAEQKLRFLLVYLHKDEAQDIDEWCRHTLASTKVTRYINTYTLFWACNVQFGEGYKVAEALKSGSYPFLAVIVLKDDQMTVVGRVEGIPSPSELLTRLHTIIEKNEISLIQRRQDRYSLACSKDQDRNKKEDKGAIKKDESYYSSGSSGSSMSTKYDDPKQHSKTREGGIFGPSSSGSSSRGSSRSSARRECKFDIHERKVTLESIQRDNEMRMEARLLDRPVMGLLDSRKIDYDMNKRWEEKMEKWRKILNW